MAQFRICYLTLLPFLALGSLSIEDRAIVPLLQRAEPTLKHFIVLQRLPVNEKLKLVIVFGTPQSQPLDDISGGGLWWTPANRLGLFLQDRADAGRVYQLAIKLGPNDDCFARIERITSRELVLSCKGEKGETCENHKFVYDVRSKRLVAQFSYPQFSVSQVLPGPQGPQFVMSDARQLLLVDIAAGANNLRVVPHEQSHIILSRIPMQESNVPGDRVYRTPIPPPDRTPAFGPGKRFRLSNETNKDGSNSRIVVEKLAGKDKMYRLPETSQDTWRLARQDDIANGIPADQAIVPGNEQIGPHQLEGDRLWFGKTFNDGEGLTGVGGFGYFDAVRRSYRLYSPPEIHVWSVSAIRVEPGFVWLALHHRGEYGDHPGGLLRWDRKTKQVRMFPVNALINQIVRYNDVLYMGAWNGIVVLRGDKIESYFVDRGADGRYRIVAREGSSQ
jgi:hypothetical protein